MLHNVAAHCKDRWNFGTAGVVSASLNWFTVFLVEGVFRFSVMHELYRQLDACNQ